MEKNQMRRTYLVTYSRVDLELLPIRDHVVSPLQKFSIQVQAQ